MKFTRTILRALLAAMACPLVLAAAEPVARVTVQADKKLLQLSELMIGANMEDLHYQMTGGISSQLIHGESFFEPSPTQLASQSGLVNGFANCGGKVSIESGEVAIERGTRLTSLFRTADRASVEVKLANGADSAGLAICVSPNNADNKWEWYSGITAEVSAKSVVLKRALRANQHKPVAEAAVTIAPGTWVKLELRLEKKVIHVSVDGKEVIAFADERDWPLGHVVLAARSDARFRNLAVLPELVCVPVNFRFEPNPLLATPGDAISMRWAKVQTGSAQGSFALETQGTWLPDCPSQTVTYTGGQGEWGIDNAGLKRWGIAVQAGKPYEGFLRVKTAQPIEVNVSFRSADGKTVYASQTLTTAGKAGEYQRIAFTLAPSAGDENGRFAITLSKPGTMTLGYVFLQPGEWGRYKGLPIRKDLAEALIAQGIGVLRFNGGMIEVKGYRWKNMRGPRDERMPYDGFYDRYCSSRFGPAEIVAFGKAAGLPVIPALNLDETPEDVADFVATCRPQFYQVANESRFNRAYVDKFKAVAEAVWKVSPDITLITTSTRASVKETDTEKEARTKLALHLELAEFARQNGRHIMFDSHSFNGAAAVEGIATFARWLQRLAPDPKLVSVGILEFNAGAFDFQRALNHSLEMNAAHRAGDVIRGVGTPNASQPWGVYQTDWKAVLWTQGNIYYTPNKVWFQPAYYVDQMIHRHWAPVVVASQTTAPEKTLDVLAAKTEDGKHLVLRVVNLAAEPMLAEIAVQGFTPASPTASVEELTGELHEFNTLEQPEKIKPVLRDWPHQMKDGRIHYTFPPNSFTMIVLQ